MKKAFGEKRRLENKIVYFKRKFNTLALPGCFYIQRVRLKKQKKERPEGNRERSLEEEKRDHQNFQKKSSVGNLI